MELPYQAMALFPRTAKQTFGIVTSYFILLLTQKNLTGSENLLGLVFV